MKEQCEDTLTIQEGDNEITFRCQKNKGHIGKHCDKATVSFQKYELKWE